MWHAHYWWNICLAPWLSIDSLVIDRIVSVAPWYFTDWVIFPALQSCKLWVFQHHLQLPEASATWPHLAPSLQLLPVSGCQLLHPHLLEFKHQEVLCLYPQNNVPLDLGRSLRTACLSWVTFIFGPRKCLQRISTSHGERQDPTAQRNKGSSFRAVFHFRNLFTEHSVYVTTIQGWCWHDKAMRFLWCL